MVDKKEAKAEGPTKKRVRNDFKTFIAGWESSNSVDEAAEKLGITREGAGQRASHYRGKGIPLKKMQRGARLDIGEAQEFLASLQAEVEAETEAEAEVETEAAE